MIWLIFEDDDFAFLVQEIMFEAFLLLTEGDSEHDEYANPHRHRCGKIPSRSATTTTRGIPQPIEKRRQPCRLDSAVVCLGAQTN
jgi:hypothetical protein